VKTAQPIPCSIELLAVEFVIEIDIQELISPSHHESLWAMAQLGTRINPDSWCLVGGLMVVVALAEQGKAPIRSAQTKDADLLVDICTSPKTLTDVVDFLENSGFSLAEKHYGDVFARCTFVGLGQKSQIDVLCPDDSPKELLNLRSDFESIAIPGGRRAMEVAQLVTIKYREDAHDLRIRVPLIAGALVVKTAAVFDERTKDQKRHLEDVVELLIGLDNPDEHRPSLSSADQNLLGKLATLIDNDGLDAWEGVSSALRNQARSALEILIRNPNLQ